MYVRASYSVDPAVVELSAVFCMCEGHVSGLDAGGGLKAGRCWLGRDCRWPGN